MSDALAVRPAGESDPLPAAIAAHKVTRAALQPDVRFNNFLAALINRAQGLPPLEHQAPGREYPWQKTAVAPGTPAPAAKPAKAR
jgi:hypothetical protein